MAQYSGKEGLVYMSATAAGAAVPFLYNTEWSATFGAARTEVTHMGNINMRYVQHIPDMQFTISGYWDDTYDSPWDNARSVDGVRAYMYPTSQVLTKYWYGPAWFTMEDMTVGVNGAVTISGSLAANGDWGQY